MALEVARRLIDGIWGTSVEDSGDGGGGSQTVTDGTTSVTATELRFPAGTVADLGGGVAGVQLITTLFGPFTFDVDTPDFVNPETTQGPVAFVVPAGSTFQTWAFLKTSFNQPGRAILGLITNPEAQSHFIQLASYYGVATPRVDAGAATESDYVVVSDTTLTLGNSITRWAYTPDERSVVVAYQADDVVPDAGEIDIYVLIATPAT